MLIQTRQADQQTLAVRAARLMRQVGSPHELALLPASASAATRHETDGVL